MALELYTAPTPNGYKASVTLEELGLDYTVHTVDLLAGEQRQPAFLALNPNGRIPVLVDDGFPVFESGALMLYLAEKTGRLLPTAQRARSEAIQWLMFQMGGLGPMMGQANVFHRYLPEKIPLAIERYQTEVRRLLEVLDARLAGNEFLAGEFSIADIANWCWARTHRWSGVASDGLVHLERWMRQLGERPACAKGITVPVDAAALRDSKGGAGTFARAARALVTGVDAED